MDINKTMTNRTFTINGEHTQKKTPSIIDLGSSSHANLLESLMKLSVSVIILLFTVKSRLSSPHNRALRVKVAMFPKAV